MNFRKILPSLVASVLMLCASLQLKAETVAITLGGTTVTNLVIGPLRLASITVNSVALTNGPIDFYDSPNTFTTNWTGAVSNYVRSVITTNIVYTSVFGVTSTNTYPVIVSATNTVAGSMKTREKIASVFSLSNSIATAQLENRYVAYGILVSNTPVVAGTVSIVITYDELK